MPITSEPYAKTPQGLVVKKAAKFVIQLVFVFFTLAKHLVKRLTTDF